MPEYISREAAKKGLCERCSDFTMCTRSDNDCPITRELNSLPAADVVKVVRCRDCKHYNAGFECLIEGYGIERPADYFCADGKRKDGGQDDG